MRKFRLKKEAVPFFKEEHATEIYCFDLWEDLNVDLKALEEVEEAYISYGHEKGNTSSLCGWGENGSHFNFTINFPSAKNFEHDKFSKGRVTRALMSNIQNEVDRFYSQFTQNKNPN